MHLDMHSFQLIHCYYIALWIVHDWMKTALHLGKTIRKKDFSLLLCRNNYFHLISCHGSHRNRMEQINLKNLSRMWNFGISVLDTRTHEKKTITSWFQFIFPSFLDLHSSSANKTDDRAINQTKINPLLHCVHPYTQSLSRSFFKWFAQSIIKAKLIIPHYMQYMYAHTNRKRA